MQILDILDRAGSERLFLFTDKPSGLRAVVCIDDLTLGPAAGGVRRMHPAARDLVCVCAFTSYD